MDCSIAHGNVEVVNISLGDVRPSTTFMMKSVLTRHVEENTMAYPGAIRYPRYTTITNKFAAFVFIFFYHIVFGTIVDTALWVMGRKPM